MIEPRNAFFVGAFIVNTVGAAPAEPLEARRGRAGRGRRAIAESREGSPGNLGGPVLSACEGAVMGCPANSKAPAPVPGLRDGGSASADTNKQAARGTGWRKQ